MFRHALLLPVLATYSKQVAFEKLVSKAEPFGIHIEFRTDDKELRRYLDEHKKHPWSRYNFRTEVRVGPKHWKLRAMSAKKRNTWALVRTTTNITSVREIKTYRKGKIEIQNLPVLSSVRCGGNISANRKYIFKLPCHLVTNPPENFVKLTKNFVKLKNLGAQTHASQQVGTYYHTQTQASQQVVTEKDKYYHGNICQQKSYSSVQDIGHFDRILYDWVKDLVVYLTTEDTINFRWELSVGDLNKNDMVTVAHTEYRNSFEIDHPNKMKFSRKVRTEQYGLFLWYTRAAPEDQQDTVHVHAVGSNFATMEDDVSFATAERNAERQERLRREVEERNEEERKKKAQEEYNERVRKELEFEQKRLKEKLALNLKEPTEKLEQEELRKQPEREENRQSAHEQINLKQAESTKMPMKESSSSESTWDPMYGDGNQ